MTVFYMSFDVMNLIQEHQEELVNLEYKYPFADSKILFKWPQFNGKCVQEGFPEIMPLKFTTCIVKDSKLLKGWAETPHYEKKAIVKTNIIIFVVT